MINSLRLLFTIFFAAVLSGSLIAAEPDAKSPEGVTKALYHSTMSEVGSSPKALDVQKKWLTTDLYARITQKMHQPTPKDEVPEIDGDLFLNAQDVPTKLEVGKTIQGKIPSTAEVEVTLAWSGEKRKYTVKLKQENGNWRVDDVIYGKDGSLRQLIK